MMMSYGHGFRSIALWSEFSFFLHRWAEGAAQTFTPAMATWRTFSYGCFGPGHFFLTVVPSSPMTFHEFSNYTRVGQGGGRKKYDSIPPNGESQGQKVSGGADER